MDCRYCFESNGNLISPCDCSGSQLFVHIACIKEWMELSGQINCRICGSQFRGIEIQAINLNSHIRALTVILINLIAFISLYFLYFHTKFFVKFHNSLSSIIAYVMSPIYLFGVYVLSIKCYENHPKCMQRM